MCRVSFRKKIKIFQARHGLTADKIQERKNIVMVNKENHFFQAAKILHILLSGSAHDIFAADVFYHQSCYIKLLINPIRLPLKDDSPKK